MKGDPAEPAFSVLKRLGKYVRRYVWLIIIAFGLTPLLIAFELAQPYLIMVAIDDHIMASRYDGLYELGALYIGMVFIGSIIDFGRNYALELAGRRTAFDLQVDLHERILELPASFFDSVKAGNLITRITSDVESVALLFSSGAVMLAADACRIVGVVVVVLVVEPEFGIVLLALLPPLALTAELSRRRFRNAWKEIRERAADMNAFVHEHVSGLKVAQAFTIERLATERFEKKHREFRRHFMSEINTSSALIAVIDFVGYAAVAVVILASAHQVARGNADFGAIVAFVSYIQKFLQPVRSLSAKFSHIATTSVGASRVFSILDRHELDAPVRSGGALLLPAPAQRTPPADVPAIAFEDVTFRYNANQIVFDGLSLTIERNRTVALIGPTGAGKSTFAKLISRLYDPEGGRVLLFGRDVQTIPRQELRKRVACIPQDVVLFSGTVAENIACFSPRPIADVERVARRVGLDRALERRQQSLNSEVSERGANFSVGERQLIALARGILHEPEVLILDEATASVDPELERLLEHNLREVLKGRTALVIAHRLATVRNADRIVILDHGRIEAEGDHRELLEGQGRYARLFELQTSGVV